MATDSVKAWHANVKVVQITPFKPPRKEATYQVTVEVAYADRRIQEYALPVVSERLNANRQATTIRDMLSHLMGEDNVKLYSPEFS